jgi:hypothetical protein
MIYTNKANDPFRSYDRLLSATAAFILAHDGEHIRAAAELLNDPTKFFAATGRIKAIAVVILGQELLSAELVHQDQDANSPDSGPKKRALAAMRQVRVALEIKLRSEAQTAPAAAPSPFMNVPQRAKTVGNTDYFAIGLGDLTKAGKHFAAGNNEVAADRVARLRRQIVTMRRTAGSEPQRAA